MVLLLLLILLGVTPSFGGSVQLPSPYASWIDTVNYYRQASGLSPITEDKSLSTAVQQHLNYLTMSDPKFFTGRFISRHLENPASPFYSHQGANAGQELTTTLTNDQSQSVDQWMSAPFHAMGFMREGLRKVGWASAYNARSGFYDAGADVLDRLDLHRTKIITFPGNGSVSRMDNFPGESPDPRDSCGLNSRSFTGLPIWVSLTSKPSHQMKAQIVTPNGQILTSREQLCVVNEYNMRTSDPIYGSAGKAILRNDHMVLLIPRDPLAPGMQTVSLLLGGKQKITWSFTVIARPPNIVFTASENSNSISWDAPPLEASNPIVGYDVVVGDENMKKFQIFRTTATNFPTLGIGVGRHWLCVKAIARYRRGECPNFTSYTVNEGTPDSTSVNPGKS